MPIPYFTRPTPDGSRVMTAIDYRGTRTKAELLAEIAARLTAGSLPTTIENVIRVYCETLIDWGMDAYKIEPFDGLLGFLMAGGGSQNDLQGPWNFDTMRLGPIVHFGEEGEQRARDAFSGDNLGHRGRVVPIFARVTDTWTGLPFHYTMGKSILIELGNRNVEFDRAKGHKVQWKLANNTLVDADDYGFAEGTRISARVPSTGVSGLISLVLTIGLNGRTVTGTYESILSP